MRMKRRSGEVTAQVNGFSSRSSRAKRRRVHDSSSSDLEPSEDEENPANADDTDQNRQPRKTAMDAVSKMMHASEEEDTSEHKPAVIQSSSESKEQDHQDDSPCQ
ncbi:bromodomain and WD repeat-containing protein 3-like isoform X1 [Clarias magur]|uniref:Bromodomain and WD repeat-containing protein 3-like isoform X1 n=1 Tax=Clarias magur TaxID=1594786 RepID=A0A8J4U4U2_CLAMG|nr:bromodomain and WD repeat-containing protein 3-like isoform X1 [Clarias magur]